MSPFPFPTFYNRFTPIIPTCQRTYNNPSFTPIPIPIPFSIILVFIAHLPFLCGLRKLKTLNLYLFPSTSESTSSLFYRLDRKLLIQSGLQIRLLDVRSRLYLESEPAGVCTFNRVSGAWVEADQYVNVNVTGVDPQYAFAGWFQGGVKITDVQSLNYLMGYHDETLVARFTLLPFNPISPSEPQTAPGQEDIQTHARGDANEDGAIDVADAVAVTNVYLTGDESGVNPTLADANNDGVIDMADVVYIINVYLTNQ